MSTDFNRQKQALVILTYAALLLATVEILLQLALAPIFKWNAIRLAWVFSFTKGYQLYYSATTGPVFAIWVGPLQALAYLPAVIFSTPMPALIFSSFISAGFYFLPVVWLCLVPGQNIRGPFLPFLCALCFFCFSTFTIPGLRYSAFNIHADAPALGLGALAVTLIIYQNNNQRAMPLLLSAILAVCSVWTKHVLLPLLLFLPVYVLFFLGRDSFRRYLAYILIVFTLLTLIFLFIFPAQNLWFYLVQIPLRTPLKCHADLMLSLQKACQLWQRNLFFILLLGVYAVYQLRCISGSTDKLKRWLSFNYWIIFAMIGTVMMPISLLCFLKLGADPNNLSFANYFWVIAFTLALKQWLSSLSSYPQFTQRVSRFAFLAFFSWLLWINLIAFKHNLHNLPKLFNSEQQLAYAYIKRHPAQAYFPMHPLAGLLAEGRLYHHSYGLYLRELTGFEVSREHFRAFIPSQIKIVAFPAFRKRWGEYTLRLLPEFSKQISVKELPGWIVYVRDDE